MNRPRSSDETASGWPVHPRSRLDAVRILVTFHGLTVVGAARVLGLHPIGRRRLYYAEQSPKASGCTPLPLLDAGVEIQISERDGDEESAVILRPCRRSRLTDHWLRFRHLAGDEFHVEAERTRDQLSLTATLTSTRPRGTLTDALAGSGSHNGVLSATQQAFLTDCADIAVEPATLRLLGPIHLRRWPATRWHDMNLGGECRTVVGRDDRALEILTLSLRVDPAGAEVRKTALDVLLHRHNLYPDDTEPMTTREVLTRLAPPPRDAPDLRQPDP